MGRSVFMLPQARALPEAMDSCFPWPVHAILTALWLLASVEVHSTTACPSQTAILARLTPLLSASGLPTTDRAELQPSPEPGQLRLTLTNADGVLIGQRDLASSGECDDLAQTVAVLVASWESDPGPGLSSPPTVTFLAAESPKPPTEGMPWEVEVGAGAGLSAISGVAGSGRFEIGIARGRSPWQARIAVMAQTERETAMLGGKVAWRHTLATLGVAWRMPDRAKLLSIDLGPTLGFATLAGQDFLVNERQRSLEYGVEVGLRLGWRWRWLAVFADARNDLWLRQQRASVDGRQATSTLDPWDLTIGLGALVYSFL